MAKENRNYSWPILGIVAIVAVVGLVMMFAQKTGTATPEEAAAGEAASLGRTTYVNLDKLNKAVVISFTENPELKSCSYFCLINKRTCVDAYLNIPEGAPQTNNPTFKWDHWIPIGCDEGGASNPIRCHCY